MRELLPQVGIIVVSGLSAIGAMALGEVIEAELMTIPFLAAPIPVIGTPANLIGTMLGAIICGVVGAIAINLINRYIAEQQESDNALAQMEKRREILELQDNLIDIKSNKANDAENDMMQSIADRHRSAGSMMAEMINNIHYDANGKKIGESRKNFWGGYDHYDASGKKTGTSREGFFGGMNHYDNNGNKTGHSHKGFFGQTNHYDSEGHKVGESTRNFWGGTNYYGSGSSGGCHSAFDEDHDAIQDEVDSFDDPDEAAEWLESEGYDPSDFDL